MGIEVGIVLALLAMFGWGFGDFFIQKATRKFGDWGPLFAITLFGAIILFPFVYKNLPQLLNNSQLWILILGSIILFFAAILDFEALRKGKLDVVEPIWSLEIPVAGLLAFIIFRESVNLQQIIFIILLIAGLALVSFKSLNFSKKLLFEKGVFIAIIAALLMGSANFLIGWGARVSDALMMNFVLNVVIAIASLAVILYKKELKLLVPNIRKEKWTWLGMCVFDNIAWVAFAYAMILAPIAIAVALSESYIIIAALLGMFINKETLHPHQKAGLVIALASAIVLAVITSN
ncbi:MAG: DMT family transporter [Nanoarchaeota archaeon]